MGAGQTQFTHGSLVGADNVTSVTLASSGAAANAAVGSYTITPSAPVFNPGSAAGNYTIAYNTGTLTVSQLVLTVQAPSPSKVYGAALPTLTPTYSGFISGDNAGNSLSATPTCTTAATASSPVGAYPVTCSGGASANYSLEFTGGTLTITKATLTVTAPSPFKFQGAPNPTLTPTYSGFVNGDTAGSSLATLPTCTTTATTGSPVGTYAVTCSGGTSDNYSFHFDSGTLTVTVQLSITLIKEICPTYSVVLGNENPGTDDATGGHAAELHQDYDHTVSPAEIPALCAAAANWQMQFWTGKTANDTWLATHTTGSNGQTTVALDPSMSARARTGSGVWVTEVTQPGAGFGSIRCYTDLEAGDNWENVSNIPNNVPLVYCIAYNVQALTLTKTASVTSFTNVNDVITYSYTLKNTGTATNVSLVRPFAVTDNKVAVTCPATPVSLAYNQSITCTADYHVTQADIDAGFVTNTATATANLGASVVTSNQASATVNGPAPRPSLHLVKTPSPETYSKVGDTIDYTFTITNDGNVTLSGPFSVTDALAAATCTQPAGDKLAPITDTMTCTASYIVTQSDIDHGSVVNTATATNGEVTSNQAEATANAAQGPKLDLVKIADPKTFSAVGDKITYTYTLTNSGNVTIGGIALSETRSGM